MLLINLRSFFCSVFTFIQILQIVLSAGKNTIFPGCKVKVWLDTDYDVEDTVRNALLNTVPDHEQLSGQSRETQMLTWEKESLREKKLRRFKSKNHVPLGDDIMEFQTDFLPLCVSKGVAKRLVLCSSIPEKKRACISENNGILEECNNIDNRYDFALTLCKEKSSKKVISCSNFDKIFICYQNINLSIELMRPCREKGRFICLSESGKLESCEKNAISNKQNIPVMNMYHKYDKENWDNWWKEWVWNRPGIGKRNPDETMPRHLCKPRPLHDTFVDCQFDQSKTKACVGTTSRNVSECKSFDDTIEVSIPICTERTTNKVFTCEDVPAAFLCFPSTNERSPVLPCRDENRQLCLSRHRLLVKCKELNNETGNQITATQTAFGVKTSEEAIGLSQMFVNRMETLCLDKYDKTLKRCNAGTLTSLACLNPMNGNIQSCRSLPKDTKTRLSICVQNQDSKMITCEKHTELCFHPVTQTTPFSQCEVTSRMICLSKEGTLMSCEVSNAMELQDALDVELRLCQKKEDKSFLDCIDDKKGRLVCFEARKGIIKACEEERPGDQSSSVCYMAYSREIHTCGRKKKRKYLCLTRYSRNKYAPCEEKERYLCLKEGAIISCKNMLLSSERSLSSMVPDYKNIERVYRAENVSIQNIFGNSQRLCQPDSMKRKFQPCQDDARINFACLEIKNEQLKMCEEIENVKLIIPICRESSGEVVVCGKFFKANLCYSSSKKSFPTSTCKNEERFACLTNYGIFKLCSDVKQIPDVVDESEIDYREIKDQKGVNKKEEVDDDEYEEMHRNQIQNKEERLRATIHMTSQHLCMTNKRSNKLINCDEVESYYFACIAAKNGNIKACRHFSGTEIALAICTQANTNILVTCDISSNTKLCFGTENKQSQLLVPCEDESRYACLGRNKRATKCNPQNNIDIQLPKRIVRQGGKDPNDEKFIRLHCSNCSIENKFVIEGNPDDVRPELEYFTLSK